MKSLSLSKPHLIVMVGVPGSGKSFFAEKFADTFHTPYVSREKLVSLAGGVTTFIDDLMYYQVSELFKTRQSLLIEGTGDTRVERLELAKWAHKAGYETLTVWVQTDPATAKSRHRKEKKSSVDAYDKLLQNFDAPLSVEKPVVISGKHTYATQARVVLKRLSEPRAETSILAAPPTRVDPSSRRRNIAIR
jgi:predicted kinase